MRLSCRLSLGLMAIHSATASPAPLAPDEIFAKVSPSVCTIRALAHGDRELALGSGVRLSVTGDVVTNLHVVQDAHRILVRCGQGEGEAIDVVGLSDLNDLIVLATTAVGPSAMRATGALRVGSAVYAIGSPLGLEGSISPGLASRERVVEGRRLLQISAPISPGNSGGPIVNDRGEVIGIAVGALLQGQNLNFAVPIDLLATVTKPAGSFPALLGSRALAVPGESSGSISPALFAFRGIKFGSPCEAAFESEAARGLSVVLYSGEKISRSSKGKGGVNERPATSIKLPTGKTVVLDFPDVSLAAAVADSFGGASRYLSDDYPGVDGVELRVRVAALDRVASADALVAYECDKDDLLTAARYTWASSADKEKLVARIVEDIQAKYGTAAGVPRPARERLPCTILRLSCDVRQTTWLIGGSAAIVLTVPLSDWPRGQRVVLQYLDRARLAEIESQMRKERSDSF